MEKYEGNLVIISVFAEAYYSGNSVNESMVITEDTYNIIKDELNKKEVHFYELDGKHSDVEGTIEVDIINNDELDLKEWDEIHIGSNKLHNILEDLLGSEELDKENEKVTEILSEIDYPVSLIITCKKSEVSKYQENGK